jgi:hypothetical protein
MTLTAAGDLGIGTSSPVGKLNIGDGDLRLTQTAGGDASGVNSYSMYFRTPSGDLAQLYCTTEGGGGPSGFGGALRIFTKPNNGSLTERARITSAGDLLVGGTSALYNTKLSVYKETANEGVVGLNHSSSVSPYGIITQFSAASPNNTTNFFFQGLDSTTTCFTIWSNGTTSGRSDERLKKNIAPASSQLSDLLAMEVVNYEWNESIDGSKEIGFTAQQVQKIKPGLISEDEKGYLHIKQTPLIPIMWKAIQELSAKVTALEAKVN